MRVSLVARSKRWVKEWLTYAIFPDGTPAEFVRWGVGYPITGSWMDVQRYDSWQRVRYS